MWTEIARKPIRKTWKGCSVRGWVPQAHPENAEGVLCSWMGSASPSRKRGRDALFLDMPRKPIQKTRKPWIARARSEKRKIRVRTRRRGRVRTPIFRFPKALKRKLIVFAGARRPAKIVVFCFPTAAGSASPADYTNRSH